MNTCEKVLLQPTGIYLSNNIIPVGAVLTVLKCYSGIAVVTGINNDYILFNFNQELL